MLLLLKVDRMCCWSHWLAKFSIQDLKLKYKQDSGPQEKGNKIEHKKRPYIFGWGGGSGVLGISKLCRSSSTPERFRTTGVNHCQLQANKQTTDSNYTCHSYRSVRCHIRVWHTFEPQTEGESLKLYSSVSIMMRTALSPVIASENSGGGGRGLWFIDSDFLNEWERVNVPQASFYVGKPR